MRALVALLALVALAAADLEVKVVQEDTSTPGVTGSAYAIVQDGRVVGVVEHYRSAGVFGRRFGPPGGDRPDSPVAQRLEALWASQADVLAALRDRLLAAPSRCPFARQMALARLQVAAAAARGDAEAAPTEPAGQHLLQRPFVPSHTKPLFGPGVLLGGGPHGGLRGGAAEPMRRRPVGGAAGKPGSAVPEASSSQMPIDHPEDLVDLPTAQQQLFGLEAGPEVEEHSVPGYNPDIDTLESLPEQPPLFGLGGRPLIPRPRLGDAAAGAAAGGEPGWAGPEQPAEVEEVEDDAALLALTRQLALLAARWARFVREPLPRGPLLTAEEPPFGGHPEPLPPMGRPRFHHHPDMAGMPGHPGMLLPRPGPMHGPGPLLRRPGPWGPGPMPRIVGGEVVVQGRGGHWVPLAKAMPAEPRPEVPQWRLWGADGAFNWGLATFIALAVACSAVWGAMLVQWAAYCRARANHNAAAFFITRVDSEEAAALKPLMHEGPVKGAGVEHAAAHVAGAQRSVKVLAYEPLKGSDDEQQ